MFIFITQVAYNTHPDCTQQTQLVYKTHTKFMQYTQKLYTTQTNTSCTHILTQIILQILSMPCRAGREFSSNEEREALSHPGLSWALQRSFICLLIGYLVLG